MMGVGMILALIVDPTMIRVLLVRATMSLLGSANWWSPAFLGRVHARYAMNERGDTAPATVPLPPVLPERAAA
jgi:RND superfamily putative drug exporter